MFMKKLFFSIALFLLSISLYGAWDEQTSGVTTALRSVSVIDQNIAWAGGASGVVLRTTNGGTTWTNVGGGAIGTNQVYNIYAINATTAMVLLNLTGFGQVYRTSDAGVTWTKVFEQADPAAFVNAVVMFSETNGFLTGDPVGGRWTNFKTTNGGVTWDSTGLYLPQAGTEAGWNNGVLVKGNKLWIGTNNSRVYYSTNAGASFTAQTMPLTNSFGIAFTSDTRGIIGGSTTGLVSTTNGGTTWTAISSLSTGTIYSVLGYGSNWYHTRGTRIFQSVDDGATWDTVYAAAAGSFYQLAQARNGTDFVIGVRSNGGIVKGTALGLPVELTSFKASVSNNSVVLNWSTATEINNRGFEVQRSSASGEFVAVGFVNGSGTTTEAQSYSFTDQVSAGTYTYRLKQLDFNGEYEYSNAIEVTIETLLSYSLDQNYPNPFNPSTTLRYMTRDAGLVTLKVYNLLGNEVAALVNEQLEAGSHQVTFDASNLSSGVYFYTLTAGSFSETRKMILMK